MTTMTKPEQTRSTQETDVPAPARERRGILARLIAALDSSAVDVRRFRV